jgi:predicted GNAT family acetyltransferase
MIKLIEAQPGEPCPDPEIEQRMSSSSKGKSTKHVVARRDGSDIGFVALDTNLGVDYLVLYELFVPTRLRGAGLGALVIAEIEKYAAPRATSV